MNMNDLPDEGDGLHHSIVSVKSQITQLELFLKSNFETVVKKIAEKPGTPKASQNLLMSETEQFVEALLQPAGNFKEYMSQLVSPVLEKLTGFEERFGKIEDFMKKTNSHLDGN